QLGVDRRPGVAENLDVPLAELAVAARLGPVVAEHRPDQGQAKWPGPDVHAVLQVRADDAGGRLRTQRPLRSLLVAAPGPGDAEHLLLDRVARLAEAAGEELDALEQRDLDPLERVAAREVAGDGLDA